MKPAYALLIWITVVLCCGRLSAQSRFDSVDIHIEKAVDDVFVLFGRGGNIGLAVGDDAAYLIDAQYAPLSDKIISAVESITDKPIKFLINTHWHGDHTGGNANFHEHGAIIVAHEEVRKRMATLQERGGGRVSEPKPFSALPELTYSKSLDIYLDSLTYMHVFHVDDAHTDGDSFVYFPTKDAIHLGDNFFNGRYPYIDVKSGGDIDGYIANLNRALMLSTENTVVIPGHGPVGNRADVESLRDILVEVRKRVKTQKAAGVTLEEGLTLGLTKEWDETHGQGFVNSERLLKSIWKTVD